MQVLCYLAPEFQLICLGYVHFEKVLQEIICAHVSNFTSSLDTQNLVHL